MSQQTLFENVQRLVLEHLTSVTQFLDDMVLIESPSRSVEALNLIANLIAGANLPHLEARLFKPVVRDGVAASLRCRMNCRPRLARFAVRFRSVRLRCDTLFISHDSI